MSVVVFDFVLRIASVSIENKIVFSTYSSTASFLSYPFQMGPFLFIELKKFSYL